MRAWPDDGAKRPGPRSSGPGLVGHESADNETAGDANPPKNEGSGDGSGPAIETQILVPGTVFAPNGPDDGPSQRPRDATDDADLES